MLSRSNPLSKKGRAGPILSNLGSPFCHARRKMETRISRSKQAAPLEAAWDIQQTAKQFKTLFLTGLVVVVDARGRRRGVNRRYCSSLGRLVRPRQDAVGGRSVL